MEKEIKKIKHEKGKLFSLFFTFLKIGGFTFGGGYAMISLLEREFVERKKWLDYDEFMNVVVIAEATPGPIAINCATYIGYKMGKLLGAVLATVAVCMPSFLIIFLISLFLNNFLEIKIVEYAFRGIQACVVYLILSAGLKMFKKMNKTFLNILLFLLTFSSILLLSLASIFFSSIYYILISIIISLIFYSVKTIIKPKKEEKNDLS